MNTLKHYALFGSICYYARGGWADIMGMYDTVEAAIAAAEADAARKGDMYADRPPIEWWHIVDLHTGHVVLRSRLTAYGQGDLTDEVHADREATP